jgi:uncharacterized protein (TIGR02246 family)
MEDPMLRSLTVSLLVVTLAVPALAQQYAPNAKVKQRVTAEITRFFQDMNEAAAKLDQEKFATHFAPNVVYVFNGVPGKGLEGLRHMHSGWDIFDSIIINPGDPPPDIAVITPEAAVVTNTRNWTAKLKTGETRPVKAAFTALLLKDRRSGWKIVQGHESTVQVQR